MSGVATLAKTFVRFSLLLIFLQALVRGLVRLRLAAKVLEITFTSLHQVRLAAKTDGAAKRLPIATKPTTNPVFSILFINEFLLLLMMTTALQLLRIQGRLDPASKFLR